METVVVVQSDSETRQRYAGWLRQAGFEVATCGGPEALDFACPVLKHCGCIDCEQSDAMVYDPCLVSQRAHPASERIIYRLREWYPEKPVVIIGCGEIPAGLTRLLAEDAGVTLLLNPTSESLTTALRRALQDVKATAGR